jgi:hypothetical protein
VWIAGGGRDCTTPEIFSLSKYAAFDQEDRHCEVVELVLELELVLVLGQ